MSTSDSAASARPMRPPLLSAGKRPDGLVKVGQPQLGQDALALILVGLLHHLGLFGAGLVDGDAGHHLLQDGGLGRKLRVLLAEWPPHPPERVTVPLSGKSTPAITLSRVDLPVPLTPMRPILSP